MAVSCLTATFSLLCAFALASMTTFGIWIYRDPGREIGTRPRSREVCNSQRYTGINSMTLSSNDFIPYRCYVHNDKFVTIFGMHLKEFQTSSLKFWMNGNQLRNVSIKSGHQTFVVDAPVESSMLIRKNVQILRYDIGWCSYTMDCPKYYDHRKDELNLCVYTKRGLAQIRPFIQFYRNFVDRIFLYSNAREHTSSFQPLAAEPDKFVVVPWYLNDLRDGSVASHVYDELVAHNWRNYSRDAQKVQTNDCMYKNRDTDMVLMVDDDEYLNFHNRAFFRELFMEVKNDYDDIILYRNFCNSSIAVETRVSTVFGTSKASRTTCKSGARGRLEKAFVFPSKCPLYEIHRCVGSNSYSLRHLNIYLAHKPYND